MIVAALLSAVLVAAPAASNIDDGADGWMDYPSVVSKGEKHLPTTISFYQGPEYKPRWNKCRLQIRQAESKNVYGALNRSKKLSGLDPAGASKSPCVSREYLKSRRLRSARNCAQPPRTGGIPFIRTGLSGRSSTTAKERCTGPTLAGIVADVHSK